MSFATRRTKLTAWLRKPINAAIAIVIALAIYLIPGLLTHQDPPQAAAIADGQPATAKGATMVRVRSMRAEAHVADLLLRARTEAEQKVELKAEMAGRVTGLPGLKGARVKKDDPICELDVGARQAQLDQANAQLKQAQLEYDAAIQLAQTGNKAKTQVAAALAAKEQAEAGVRLAQTQLGYATIRAPFDGVVGQRFVSIGDYMVAGNPCAFIVGADPFLVVGAVSESQIAAVSEGNEGTAKLVTGETVSGKVTFLANAADEKTRTFRIELTVPNPDFKLHDGVTADLRVRSRTIPAMKISPAILSLDSDGKIGVKIVENSLARFVQVALIEDSPEGLWISGLPEQAMVITVGQDFVKDGDPVNAVPEESVTASGEQPRPAQAN